jgi:hypothetical protein
MTTEQEFSRTSTSPIADKLGGNCENRSGLAGV